MHYDATSNDLKRSLDTITWEIVVFLLDACERAGDIEKCQGVALLQVQEDLDYSMLQLGHLRRRVDQFHWILTARQKLDSYLRLSKSMTAESYNYNDVV